MYRYAIRHPYVTIAVALLVTLAAAPGGLRLKLRTDGHALVPSESPQIQFDASIREEFGLEDPVVVMIRTSHAGGIFNEATLKLVNDLTEEFAHIQGVREATLFSLATEHTFRVRPGTLFYRTFLENFPDTYRELESLRSDLHRIELYNGTLVSADRKGTLILVGAPPEIERIDFYNTVKGIIARQGPIEDEVHVMGAPVAEALLGTHILEDLGVPRAVLGASVRNKENAPSFPPSTFYQWKRFVAYHIGLVPVALGVMAFVFLIAFRSVAATSLPLIEVGACLTFVFGLMGWFGVPIYLTMAVLPIILTAMGVADEIHIFHRYAHLLRGGGSSDHRATLLQCMNELAGPVVKTSVTTAVGFLSFALSSLEPVRAFGIFTAVGILFCMLWSLTVIPAMLSLIPAHRIVSRKRLVGSEQAVHRRSWFRAAGPMIIRGRWVFVLVALAIACGSITGVRKVTVQDSWIDGFDPESEFRESTETFNEQYLGTHLLLVVVDAGKATYAAEIGVEAVDHHEMTLPGDIVDDPRKLVDSWVSVLLLPGADGKILSDPLRVSDDWSAWIETAERVDDHIIITTPKTSGSPKFGLRPKGDDLVRVTISSEAHHKPSVLKEIERFEQFLRSYPSPMIGEAHGAATYVATSNFMTHPSEPEYRRIPDDTRTVRWLWEQYARIRGQDSLRQLVSEDFGRSVITVYLKNANFVEVGDYVEDIRAYEREHLASKNIRVGFAGDVVVSQTLIEAIVTTQVQSLLISLLGILVVSSLLNRSILWGALCVLPCGLAVLLNFAFMGWSGMPLGVATSMFAGMTLGIGVDFAIHFTDRFRMERREKSVEAAIAEALAVTGPAIIIDALTIALGFGVMTLSQVPANARLGLLVLASIVSCSVITLVLLPCVLRIFMAGDERTDAGA